MEDVGCGATHIHRPREIAARPGMLGEGRKALRVEHGMERRKWIVRVVILLRGRGGVQSIADQLIKVVERIFIDLRRTGRGQGFQILKRACTFVLVLAMTSASDEAADSADELALSSSSSAAALAVLEPVDPLVSMLGVE